MYKNYEDFKKIHSDNYPRDLIAVMWTFYQQGRAEGYEKAMKQLRNIANIWCMQRENEYRAELLKADGDHE